MIRISFPLKLQSLVLAIWFSLFSLLMEAQQKPAKKANTASNNGVDIYMAVNISNQKSGNTTVGYWKNGLLTPISEENNNTAAVSLSVDGENIYTAGYFDNQAAYWKNDQLIQLTNKPDIGDAVSVASVGGHLYVAGKERKIRRYSTYNGGFIDMPTVWKDGTPTRLTNLTLETIGDHENRIAGVIAMTVDNNGDIYMVGNEPGPDATIHYWKNGQKVKELVDIPVSPVNMYIINGDFYVVGVLGRNGKAAYWKWSKGKTELITLTTADDSKADALAVSGNDVYVAGHEGGVGKYWKNGRPVTLAGGPLNFMGTYGLAVLGSDVYVTGPDVDGNTKCWKNGKEFIVLPGMSVAGIVVKKAKGRGYVPGTATVQHEMKTPSPAPAPPSAPTPSVKTAPPPAPAPSFTTPPPPTPAQLEKAAKAAAIKVEQANRYLAENKLKPGVITTASGLQYEILQPKPGIKPTLSDRVRYKVTRTNIVGNEVKGDVLVVGPVDLSMSSLVPGLAEGVKLMSPGARYRFTIPPPIGYDLNLLNQPADPDHPLGAVILVMEVELLAILKN